MARGEAPGATQVPLQPQKLYRWQGVLMAPSGKSVTPERASDKDKALEAALVQI
jgi:hypothetical protein